jgi:hypothetical protein
VIQSYVVHNPGALQYTCSTDVGYDGNPDSVYQVWPCQDFGGTPNTVNICEYVEPLNCTAGEIVESSNPYTVNEDGTFSFDYPEAACSNGCTTSLVGADTDNPNGFCFGDDEGGYCNFDYVQTGAECLGMRKPRVIPMSPTDAALVQGRILHPVHLSRVTQMILVPIQTQRQTQATTKAITTATVTAILIHLATVLVVILMIPRGLVTVIPTAMGSVILIATPLAILIVLSVAAGLAVTVAIARRAVLAIRCNARY